MIGEAVKTIFWVFLLVVLLFFFTDTERWFHDPETDSEPIVTGEVEADGPPPLTDAQRAFLRVDARMPHNYYDMDVRHWACEAMTGETIRSASQYNQGEFYIVSTSGVLCIIDPEDGVRWASVRRGGEWETTWGHIPWWFEMPTS